MVFCEHAGVADGYVGRAERGRVAGAGEGTALGAQDHQDVPFEQVVEIVQPPRRLSHTPVFQVMFSWQNNIGSLPELPGVRVERLRMPYEAAKFDLQLELAEEGERIVGGLNYAMALFEQGTIERQTGYLLRCWRRWWPTASRR